MEYLCGFVRVCVRVFFFKGGGLTGGLLVFVGTLSLSHWHIVVSCA